jgi:aryl-alcohol dehydrogenase-like predicted oxidoreductase
MDKRQIGRSGLRVSTIGLGCNNFGWKIGQEESNAVVAKALDLGITLFDTADRYGTAGGDSEIALGKALGARRKDIVLLTKFGVDLVDYSRNSSRRYVISAAEASLRRLGTDWIDIYMIHWPDYATPMEETPSPISSPGALPTPCGSRSITASKPSSPRRTSTTCSSATPRRS